MPPFLTLFCWLSSGPSLHLCCSSPGPLTVGGGGTKPSHHTTTPVTNCLKKSNIGSLKCKAELTLRNRKLGGGGSQEGRGPKARGGGEREGGRALLPTQKTLKGLPPRRRADPREPDDQRRATKTMSAHPVLTREGKYDPLKTSGSLSRGFASPVCSGASTQGNQS